MVVDMAVRYGGEIYGGEIWRWDEVMQPYMLATVVGVRRNSEVQCF